MLIHWIWLAHRPGLTDWAKAKLLRHFGDPEDIYHASLEELGSVVDLSAEAGKTLWTGICPPHRKSWKSAAGIEFIF